MPVHVLNAKRRIVVALQARGPEMRAVFDFGGSRLPPFVAAIVSEPGGPQVEHHYGLVLEWS